MMRRTAAGLALFLTVCMAYADFDAKGWTWRRPLETGNTSGFVALPVSPEIFDQSQPSLDDLRVVDASGHLVPHVVSWGKTSDSEREEWRPVKLLNPTYQPNQYSRVTLDFGAPVEKNRLRIRAAGQNFRRAAIVEGSTDSQKWEMVAEGLWLFDVSLPGKEFRVDTLHFPANNFRYLRVTLNNMPDDPRRVDIASAEGSFVQRIEEKALAAAPVALTAAQLDEKGHESIWEFDTGYRNLPLWEASFQFGDPFFHRGFEIRGRNSLKHVLRQQTETGPVDKEIETPWQGGAGGVLFRIKEKDKTSEQSGVRGVPLPYRYLQLRVFNQDNPPLHLTTCTLMRRTATVIFQAAAGRSLTLLGGNPNCGAASYDIAASIRTLEGGQLPRVSAGRPVAVTAETALAPWSERNARLIWAALIAGVAAMLFVVLRNLKQLPKPDGGPPGA